MGDRTGVRGLEGAGTFERTCVIAGFQAFHPKGTRVRASGVEGVEASTPTLPAGMWITLWISGLTWTL
jgi:hypothetical protein